MIDFMKHTTVFSPIISVWLFLNATSAILAANPSATLDIEKLMQPSGNLKEMVEGDSDAPVTIVEYASITCIHCADFHQYVLPQIREKYIKTGKVRLIFREFAYDPRAVAGFMLSRCAPEDRYFPLIQVLFEKQAEWAFVPDAKSPLSRFAKLAGFTDKTFESCLNDQRLLENLNDIVQRGRDEFGITSTPTFFVNGNRYEGMLSVKQMFSIIDSLL